ncbi:methionine--tRNA ligase, mitochondrial isoform X3 [Cryptotermes secundus]|uniref:methionine--tRNA ligase, mitochondrial isoform X3 n=1 Tax=Cryptotermes secundus TaxID=105785 RepID=UPI000CD7C737|nr:methionine--tRNA ligase, mitochondrial isoform X3 [Cryptotermes secundus]
MFHNKCLLCLRLAGRSVLFRRKSTYFITTPIFYVNAPPHIGHVYTAVIADAAHRFQMLLGCQETVFSTGTDEHGTKIQEAALQSGSPLPQYCDHISLQYRTLFQSCNIDYTDFVRTTEDRHKSEVHKFWNVLQAGGHIYLGTYSGWYCTPDETFLSENQLAERQGPDGCTYKVSAESGHPVEWTNEENFMFKLSSFQDDLLRWLQNGLEPPRSLLCHSHWKVDGKKMSKSKGNIIDPLDCIVRYTASGLRYFLLREGVAHSDGNYSETKAIRILNSELADSLGNLLNRCSGKTVNPDQIFPKFCQHSFSIYCNSDEALKLVESLSALPDLVKDHFLACNFYKGIDCIVATLHAANRFFESQKPWELCKKHQSPHQNGVLHLTMETLRVCGILLQPIVPELSDTLLRKIGISKEKRMWKDIRPFSWEQGRLCNVPISAEKIMLYKRIMVSKS